MQYYTDYDIMHIKRSNCKNIVYTQYSTLYAPPSPS